MKTIVITGFHGLVGNRLATQLGKKYTIIATDRSRLDITDTQSVEHFLEKSAPDIIINAAAFADVTLAEQERGNKNGLCWKVNVEGTRNLVASAKKIGAFVVLLSTGSVFSGTDSEKGPFSETDAPSPKKRLGWYAYTKLVAEQSGVDAVVRLSHVIGPKHYVAPNGKSDYLQNIIALYKKGTLYPLFTDQLFPVTYIDDVALAVETVGSNHYRGVHHIVSSDMTTPYELARYALGRDELPTITFSEFIRTVSLPLRYSQFHAIEGTLTRSLLHLPKRSWRDIVSSSIR